MVVSHFLKWVNTAKVAERAAAAAALARAYVDRDLPFEDRCAAEAALTLLLDDPSSKVRLAIAEALSMSHHAPAQIVAALASDQPEVAAIVLSRSPLFSDADLIDRVASGPAGHPEGHRRTRRTCRCRWPRRSPRSATPTPAPRCSPIRRPTIASLSFRRIAERHGQSPRVREAMVADPRLPSDCRHMLLVKVGEALKASRLVVALIGSARAERVTRDACAKACVTLIDGTRMDEHAALVEHLRLRGDLTSGLHHPAVAHGKIDFFGSVLVALTGQAETARDDDPGGRARCRRRLAAAHRRAWRIGTAQGDPAALKVWREVANGKRIAGAQEVTWLMLRELGETPEDSGIAGLIKSIHLDTLRENARGHALAIAAA